MSRWLGLCLMASGCFQTTHMPTCAEEDVQEVADDEETAAGTAQALLAVLAIDGQGTLELEDGTSLPGRYRVERGEGSARFVHSVSDTQITRSPGFGSFYPAIHVQCSDQLVVPVQGELASDDGALFVPVLGEAAAMTPVTDTAPLSVYMPFEDALLPAVEADPSEFTDKQASFQSTADPVGVVGEVGWEGTQETPDYVSRSFHTVATFEFTR